MRLRRVRIKQKKKRQKKNSASTFLTVSRFPTRTVRQFRITAYKCAVHGNLCGQKQFAVKLHCLTAETKKIPSRNIFLALFPRPSRILSNRDPRGVFIIPGALPISLLYGEKIEFFTPSDGKRQRRRRNCAISPR